MLIIRLFIIWKKKLQYLFNSYIIFFQIIGSVGRFKNMQCRDCKATFSKAELLLQCFYDYKIIFRVLFTLSSIIFNACWQPVYPIGLLMNKNKSLLFNCFSCWKALKNWLRSVGLEMSMAKLMR